MLAVGAWEVQLQDRDTGCGASARIGRVRQELHPAMLVCASTAVLKRTLTCRGFGHTGDQAFEFVDPGLQVAVQQISARWWLGDAGRKKGHHQVSEHDTKQWWIPRTWSSSNLI